MKTKRAWIPIVIVIGILLITIGLTVFLVLKREDKKKAEPLPSKAGTERENAPIKNTGSKVKDPETPLTSAASDEPEEAGNQDEPEESNVQDEPEESNVQEGEEQDNTPKSGGVDKSLPFDGIFPDCRGIPDDGEYDEIYPATIDQYCGKLKFLDRYYKPIHDDQLVDLSNPIKRFLMKTYPPGSFKSYLRNHTDRLIIGGRLNFEELTEKTTAFDGNLTADKAREKAKEYIKTYVDTLFLLADLQKEADEKKADLNTSEEFKDRLSAILGKLDSTMETIHICRKYLSNFYHPASVDELLENIHSFPYLDVVKEYDFDSVEDKSIMNNRILLNDHLLRGELEPATMIRCYEKIFHMFLTRVEFDRVRISRFLSPEAIALTEDEEPEQKNIESVMEYAKLFNLANLDTLLKEQITMLVEAYEKPTESHEGKKQKIIEELNGFLIRLDEIRSKSIAKLTVSYPEDIEKVEMMSDRECNIEFLPIYIEMIKSLNRGEHAKYIIPTKLIMNKFNQKFIEYYEQKK